MKHFLYIPANLLRRNAATASLVLACGALASAFAIQRIGYEPCELCLRQRIPYYAGVPLLVAAVATRRLVPGADRIFSALMAAASIAFLVAFALAAHHLGVEHGLWEGPARCVSRSFDMSSIEAFTAQIGSTPMVSCNVPAFRLLGFSLASWNVLVTATISMTLLQGFKSVRILKKSIDP